MDIENYIYSIFRRYFSTSEHADDIIEKRRTTFKDDDGIEKSKRYFYKYICSYIVVILLSFYLIKDKCIHNIGNNSPGEKYKKIHYESKEEKKYVPILKEKLRNIDLDTKIDFNIIMASEKNGKSCQSNVKLNLQNFYIYCIRGSRNTTNKIYNYNMDTNGTYDSEKSFLDACGYLRGTKPEMTRYANVSTFSLYEILKIIDDTPELIIPSILPVINTLRLYSNTWNFIKIEYTGYWTKYNLTKLKKYSKKYNSLAFEYKQPNPDELKLLFREISEVPLSFNVNSNNTRKVLEYCLYNGYFEFINISYINTENTNRDDLINLMRNGLTEKLTHFFNYHYIQQFIYEFFKRTSGGIRNVISQIVSRIPKIIELVLNLHELNEIEVLRTISNDQSGFGGTATAMGLTEEELTKYGDYFTNFRKSYEIVHLFSILNAYKQCYRNLDEILINNWNTNTNINTKPTTNNHNEARKLMKNTKNRLKTHLLENHKNTNTPLLLENHRNRSQIQKFNETKRIYEILKSYIENSSTKVLYDEFGHLRNLGSIQLLRNHAINSQGLNENIVKKLLGKNTELTKLFENKKNTVLRQRLLEFKSQIDSAIGDDKLSIPPTLKDIDYKEMSPENQEKLKRIIKNWINAEKPTTTRHKNDNRMKEVKDIRYASFYKMAYLLLYFPNVIVEIKVTKPAWNKISKSVTEWYHYRTEHTTKESKSSFSTKFDNHSMINDLKDFHQMRTDIELLRDLIFLERYDVRKNRNNKLNIPSEKLDIPVYAYDGFKLNNVRTHYKTLAQQYPNTLFIFNDGITVVNGRDGNAEIRGMPNAMPIPLGAYRDNWSHSYAENITNKNSINANTLIKLYNAYISANQVEPYTQSDKLTFENIIDIAIYYIKEQCKKNNFNSIVYSSEQESNKIGLGLFQRHTSQNIVDLVTTKLFDISQQVPSVVNYQDLIRNIRLPNNTQLIRQYALAPRNTTKGGSKKVRKHQGIYQKGPKKGKLKPGYKYSGKKTKTGLKIIVKVKK